MPAIAVGQSAKKVESESAFASKLAPTGFLWCSQNHVSPQSIVGAGLPAITVGQSAKKVESESAFASKLAPTGFLWCSQNHVSPQSIVGAGLPAKAVGQSAKRLSLNPPSRASSLPQFFVVFTKPCFAAVHCGSGLARESGGSVSEKVESESAFASKLAHSFLWCSQNHVSPQSIVGAGLPAITVGQSAKRLNLNPPSRATSHSFLWCSQNHVSPQSIVGAGLPAKAMGQSMKKWAGYAFQGDVRMSCTKFIGLNPGS